MSKRYLDPQNPIAFKRLFGKEENKELLRTFLDEVLKEELKAPLKEVKLLTPFQELEARTQKQSILDVHCRDAQGNECIIEMHAAQQKDFPLGPGYYTAKALCQRVAHEPIHQSFIEHVVFLTFCPFSVFPKKEHYKIRYHTVHIQTNEQELNKLCYAFVELLKFEEKRHKEISQLTQEEKFYYLLLHAPQTTPEEVAVLTRGDKVLAKAYRELDRARWSPAEMKDYENAQKRMRRNKPNAAMQAKEEDRT